MSPVAFRIWLLLGGVSAADLLWCAGEGLTVSNWQPFLLVATSLFALTLVARRAGLARLGAMAEWMLIWLT